jgi:hypothetical protein
MASNDDDWKHINDVRFVPGKRCAQLISLLPLIKGKYSLTLS